MRNRKKQKKQVKRVDAPNFNPKAARPTACFAAIRFATEFIFCLMITSIGKKKLMDDLEFENC